MVTFRKQNSFPGCIIFILLLVMLPSLLLSAEEPQKTPLEPEQALSLITVYSWTNTYPRDLIDLQNDAEATADLATFERELPRLSKQIDDLEWEAVSLKSNSNLTYHELVSFDAKLVKLNLNLENINKPVSSHVELLEKWYKTWLEKEQQLGKLKEQIKTDQARRDSFPPVESLSKTVTKAKTLIEQQLRPNLLAGQQIGEAQTRVYVLKDTVADLLRDMKKTGTQQTSPPMLSPDFYKNINTQLFLNGWQDIKLFALYQLGYLKEHLGGTLVVILGTILLAIAIHFSTLLVNPSAGWYPFATRPIASALFIVGTAFSFLLRLQINITLPPNWDILLQLPLVIASILLVDLVCTVKWQCSLVKQLLAFFSITLILTIIDLPQLLFYLFVFYVSVALVSYYFLLFVRRWLAPSQRQVTWAVLLWAVFPLAIIIAGIAGFDQFAVSLSGRVLSFVGVTIIIGLMVKMSAGLLEMFLTNIPIKIIRQNASTIVQQILPVLILAHALLWLAIVLLIFYFFPTLRASFHAITSLQFSIFSFAITPGSILTIVFIIYASLLVSRGLSAFLKQEVLPRYKVEQGVQISITRLVHYAILSIGFIILLSALGFGLNQITIIGGALGVGIGFGLQAIVNNFVSGLILLFERPIKVGDMIEVGTEMGEVKELGLRATIVQTFDNAEIVIPNSQLISGSVTNWTLAEKKIRVKVPVGVAYGSDIASVLKVLLSCADDNANVLTTPKPAALFLAFGASSLDFELRVWIPDFNDKLTVLSEINQDIEYEFDRAGIEIPFPQSDLHLRSIDEEALALLGKKTGE